MDPLSDRDQFAAAVLERIKNSDEITRSKFHHGALAPLEIARIAGEVYVHLIRGGSPTIEEAEERFAKRMKAEAKLDRIRAICDDYLDYDTHSLHEILRVIEGPSA